MYTREDLISMIVEEDVEFIRLQFVDIFGNLKNVAITSSQFENALAGDCSFDASCIEGFDNPEETNLYLQPDLDTFVIFPWRPQQGKVARLICDVCKQNGEPFYADTRSLLKRVVKEAAEMGYTMQAGPECEFFLFDTDENGHPTTNTLEQAGYFAMGPTDFGENARRDIVLTLEDMGFTVEASHHEMAPAQHEIDFKYDEAMKTADNVMTFKLVVKTMAKRHGLHATFMPKPKQGVNGSGMHINMSLHKDGVNIFCDDTDPNGLSKEAYYFIGGIMKHIKGMTAILNPLVNSYKRIVPGFEAPTEIEWSMNKRNCMIRVPKSKAGVVRVELRSPDPSCNPYMALAVLLKAGLDGIRNQIMPENKGDSLPGNLIESLEEINKDELLREVLGEDLLKAYNVAKMKECQEYIAQVSQWEIDKYLLNF